jgi:hypothetical protein
VELDTWEGGHMDLTVVVEDIQLAQLLSRLVKL